jgi:hypothetical protein
MTETVIFSRRQSEEMVLGEGDAARACIRRSDASNLGE